MEHGVLCIHVWAFIVYTLPHHRQYNMCHYSCKCKKSPHINKSPINFKQSNPSMFVCIISIIHCFYSIFEKIERIGLSHNHWRDNQSEQNPFCVWSNIRCMTCKLYLTYRWVLPFEAIWSHWWMSMLTSSYMRLTWRVCGRVILWSSKDVVIKSICVVSFVHVFFFAIQGGM